MDITLQKVVEILDAFDPAAVIDEWRWSRQQLHPAVEEQAADLVAEALLNLGIAIARRLGPCGREVLRRDDYRDAIDAAADRAVEAIEAHCSCRE